MSAMPQNDTRQQAQEQPTFEANPFYTAETSDTEDMARWMLACQEDDEHES